MLKKILFTSYIIVVAVMAAATLVEKYRGTDFAHAAVYGSWWFVVLWALLAVTAAAYILRRRLRRPSVLVLHASLLLILAGALATRVSAEHGKVHLRCGLAVDTYAPDGTAGRAAARRLPFALRLDTFAVRYHDGTKAVADYVSRFTVIEDGRETQAEVSMNHIFSHRSVRFCQATYDSDRLGSTLAVNYDPYGIPLTYAGYVLLFAALLWTLVDPKGTYRRLLRHPLLRRGVLSLAALSVMPASAQAAPVLPKETAGKFGELYVLYNDRVCPLQTLAIDFTKKLCGSASYKGYTPEQVLTGFLFWGKEWSAEPIIKVKRGALRDRWQLPRHCSVNTFFNPLMGGYLLGPGVQEYYSGRDDKLHRQIADMDDRLMMVMNLRRGTLLKVFPYTSGGKTTWYSPADNLSGTPVDDARRMFMRNVFSLVWQEALAGRTDSVDSIFGKMAEYQKKNAGSSLPSAAQVKAERWYNAVPIVTVLFMFNLAAGVLLMALSIGRLAGRARRGDACAWPTGPFPGNLDLSLGGLKGRRCMAARMAASLSRRAWLLLAVSFAALTACLALRWVIGGRVPMANGYETMLLMAWLVMLLGLSACRWFRIALPFSLLMSGFFLLVAHISGMDPQITHVMPVLSSPLLSVHVSVIMMSFALLSLTFAVGVTALVLRAMRRSVPSGGAATEEALALFSRLLLYPALALLAVGVFVGAVWAGISWGTYWSWDAKEVWGLITLMVYAVAVHDRSLPFLRRPSGYHAFMVLAFLSILMTYFGVNYFLGGLHSYA